MTDTPSNKPAQYQGKTERVEHLPQVIGLLRRIKDHRILLSVRVPGHEGTYNSLLLEVDADRQCILLDELNPRTGHDLLAQVGQVRVHCQCQGVELSFICPVEIGQGREGISFYKAALPAYINYLQRRRNYRVRVTFDMQVPVHLPVDEEHIVDGQLFDVSVGGIGFNIDLKTELERGQILENCNIELSNKESLHTPLEVRFIQPDPQQRIQRIGAAFVNLEPAQEHAIRRFVTQLERTILRRKARR